MKFFKKRRNDKKKAMDNKKNIELPPSIVEHKIIKGSKVPVTNERKIRELFINNADVTIKKITFGNEPHEESILFVYCKGLCNVKEIDDIILPRFKEMFSNLKAFKESELLKGNWLRLSPVKIKDDLDPIISFIFSGDLILYFEKLNKIYTMSIADIPNRQPEESSTELAIRGPRDDFIEDIHVNVALIRKRLKTNSLCFEIFNVGKRSHLPVGLLYMRDIVDMSFIKEARNRLKGVNVDGVTTSAEIEHALSDQTFSFFPLFDYTGRPDFAVEALLSGRFIIITDGSPTVSIAPANLSLMLKAPEDRHFSFFYSSFARLVRFVGLFITLFLPGFYIALISYHQDQIPFLLLATIASARLGIPLSPPFEMLLILTLYELFHEAGIRLPKAVGQTLTVVGGLIIGDAAIRAGLATPTTIVVASLTAVTRYTLVNQNLSTIVGTASLFVLFNAMFLGMFGFILSVFGILLLLSNLTSFGMPLLQPLANPSMKNVVPALIQYPWIFNKERPSFLNPKDKNRRGGKKS